MVTKLTLTIEDSVANSAKKHVSQKGKSLSAIVENYLKSVSAPENSEEKLSPKVLKMIG
jgi:LysM repeat protein